MTISQEAKEAATAELLAYDHPSIYDTHERGHYVQLAINSATASLQKEIERLRGEVSRAYHEGMIDYSTEGEEFHCVAEPLWINSRAKRVAEGKE